jgi:ABC-type polysaccharide/polyol phosphate transport system ATPase subunit
MRRSRDARVGGWRYGVRFHILPKVLPDGAIRADHIWKRFRPDRADSLLRYELERLGARIRGRELAWSWALKDVSLNLEPGEAVGLVGNNGSGKSTLLKILTGVMDPYAGRLETSGRIGALIEVKAGISPELTGRENLFLTGTLLGLSRKQVAQRADEIVAFAQLEDSINRQVKFYSTGMQMRLGFAIAAYLEPDILLVDEVLAVGDAAFQARCLDRMREVLAQGTTLVFVSHDLHAVSAICNRAMWLRFGEPVIDAEVAEVLRAYRADIEHLAELTTNVEGPVVVTGVSAENPVRGMPTTQQPLDVTLRIEADQARDVRFFIGITEGTADPIFVSRKALSLEAGLNEARWHIEQLPLPRGRYYVWLALIDRDAKVYLQRWHPVSHFDVLGPDLDKPPGSVVRRAPVHIAYELDTSPVAHAGRAVAGNGGDERTRSQSAG